MKRIEINFDIIDKTYEARGMHNVRRWLRINKAYNISAASYCVIQGVNVINGEKTIEDALLLTLAVIAVAVVVWGGKDFLDSLRETKKTGLNYKDRAYYELILLSEILREYGLDISPEQMMKAKIYNKKYKLAMDGRVGIIRDRYFEMPFTDKTGEEKQTSVKEEHILGTKKYVLTLDKPTEQTEYELAYNM